MFCLFVIRFMFVVHASLFKWVWQLVHQILQVKKRFGNRLFLTRQLKTLSYNDQKHKHEPTYRSVYLTRTAEIVGGAGSTFRSLQLSISRVINRHGCTLAFFF